MTDSPVPLRHGYSSGQIAMHWIVVALFAVNWFLGESMSHVFDATREGGGEAATEAVVSYGGAYTHIIIGSMLLVVMLARLAGRISRPVATDPDSDHPLLATLGTINHWAFYGLLIVIPILGLFAWFAGSEAAGGLHGLLVTVTLVLIAVHVLAGLFHQFVLRDNLLRRMLRPTGGT